MFQLKNGRVILTGPTYLTKRAPIPYRHASQEDLEEAMNKEKKTTLKVYTCNTFSGHWMSGTAVVVANSKREARKLLAKELKNQGFKLKKDDEIELLNTKDSGAWILFDGDY